MISFEEHQAEIDIYDCVTDMLACRETIEEDYCTFKATILDLLEKHGPPATKNPDAKGNTIIRESMRSLLLPSTELFKIGHRSSIHLEQHFITTLVYQMSSDYSI
jgi:hypothetical protein